MGARNVDAILADLAITEECYDDLEKLRTGRFLLIERNERGPTPPFWASTWESREEAARYHVGQEYREDWAIVCLIDLAQGVRWKAEVINEVRWTDWVEASDG